MIKLINMNCTMSPIEAPLWTPSCKSRTLDSRFLVYIHGSWAWGKPYGIKTQVLLGTSWGMHLKTLWKLGNPLRIWELIKNIMGRHWEEGKKQNLPIFPPSLKEKKLDHFTLVSKIVKNVYGKLSNRSFNFNTHHYTTHIKLQSQRRILLTKDVFPQFC
jgi:hypothetical protein